MENADNIVKELNSFKSFMVEEFFNVNKHLRHLHNESFRLKVLADARFDALSKRLFEIETRLSAIEIKLNSVKI